MDNSSAIRKAILKNNVSKLYNLLHDASNPPQIERAVKEINRSRFLKTQIKIQEMVKGSLYSQYLIMRFKTGQLCFEDVISEAIGFRFHPDEFSFLVDLLSRETEEWSFEKHWTVVFDVIFDLPESGERYLISLWDMYYSYIYEEKKFTFDDDSFIKILQQSIWYALKNKKLFELLIRIILEHTCSCNVQDRPKFLSTFVDQISEAEEFVDSNYLTNNEKRVLRKTFERLEVEQKKKILLPILKIFDTQSYICMKTFNNKK